MEQTRSAVTFSLYLTSQFHVNMLLGEQMGGTSHQLPLIHVDKSHSGVYTCTVRGDEKLMHVSLLVSHQPHVSAPHYHVSQLAGTSVQLDCEVRETLSTANRVYSSCSSFFVKILVNLTQPNTAIYLKGFPNVIHYPSLHLVPVFKRISTLTRCLQSQFLLFPGSIKMSRTQ